MYLNSIQAQIILNNFKTFEEKMKRLENIVDIYNRELGYDNTSLHLYRIKVTDNQQFINQMNKDNIICGIHYSALHLSDVYYDSNYVKPYKYNKEFLCPKSKELQHKTVSLPMNEDLRDDDIFYIINKVKENI